MWEMIYPDLQAGFDVNWLIAALTNRMLMGVTDGSYNRARNPSTCGAGWILMDINSGQRLAGAFTESSDLAGSYCGELLGLYALNHVILHIYFSESHPNATWYSLLTYATSTTFLHRNYIFMIKQLH